jgi:hypothetical protein
MKPPVDTSSLLRNRMPSALHRPTHTRYHCQLPPHLPLQPLPPEGQCCAPACCQLLALAAVVVGVEHKAAIIIACSSRCKQKSAKSAA